MSEPEIRKSLNDALRNVSGAAGINNHTGSKATEDLRFMKIVLGILKERNLFFVDSLVTNHSVCSEIASQIRLPFAQRDVFLDNENERAYIENQFALLAQKAKEEGYALGIGHARKLTLEIIREQTEILKNQGFEFITVKNLIKQK